MPKVRPSSPRTDPSRGLPAADQTSTEGLRASPEQTTFHDYVARHTATEESSREAVVSVRGESGRAAAGPGSGAEPLEGKRSEPHSLVHTSQITRPRHHWLRQLERHTDDHRRNRAQQHWARGAQLKQERLEQGETYDYAASGLRWHRRRAFGQIDRFAKVYDCGNQKCWLKCTECERVTEKVQPCRIPLLCVSCRGKFGADRRNLFQRARERSRSRAAASWLLQPQDRRRWSEKLLTLTAPHVAEHDVARRVGLIMGAWRVFLKGLNRYLDKVAPTKKSLVAWFRSFEWTPGSDGHGHPHFHVWLLTPFLEPERLRRLWSNALRTAGYSVEQTTVVVLDIRSVKDGEGAAREVIKYLTKDIMPDRSMVSPAVFAELYKVLDGKRTTQASAGFFKNLNHEAQCACGATGCFMRLNEPPNRENEQ